VAALITYGELAGPLYIAACIFGAGSGAAFVVGVRVQAYMRATLAGDDVRAYMERGESS